MTQEDKNPECNKCKYFQSYGTSGECRRRAPIVRDNSNSEFNHVFPQLNWKSWCGEYKPKEQNDTERSLTNG